ncbi:hypothetical protein LCGC14_2307290 [marine sediment metagenome]|uniref:Uncharacterized protein n=1 Tax=marine sediment metagenome TaxID=412755 RepID=A0A0F9EZ46_9ZZZZ
MSKYITVQCPKCGAPGTFDYDGIAEEDALVLIGEDARCCRRCGTLFVERESEDEDEDESKED